MKVPKALWVVATLVIVESSLFLMDDSFESQFEGARLRTMFFSPDSQTVYGGGSDFVGPYQMHNWLWAWDAKTGRQRWKSPIPKSTYPIKLSPNGASLVVQPAGEGLQLWDTGTGRLRCKLEAGPPLQSLGWFAFTPDSKRIMGCYRTGIQVWDTQTGARKAFWKVPKGVSERPESVQFFPDSSKLLVGLSNWNNDGWAKGVQVWDSRNGRVLKRFETSAAPCALSPSGAKVAFVYTAPHDSGTSLASRWIVVHDVRSGALEAQTPDMNSMFKKLESLEFTSESRLRFKRSYEGAGEGTEPQVFQWDFRDSRASPDPITEVADNTTLSSDNSLKVVANRGRYRKRLPLGAIYDAATNKKLCDLEGLAGR